MALFSVSPDKISHQVLKVALPPHFSHLLPSCTLLLILCQIAPHCPSASLILKRNSDHFKPLSSSRTLYIPSLGRCCTYRPLSLHSWLFFLWPQNILPVIFAHNIPLASLDGMLLPNCDQNGHFVPPSRDIFC